MNKKMHKNPGSFYTNLEHEYSHDIVGLLKRRTERLLAHFEMRSPGPFLMNELRMVKETVADLEEIALEHGLSYPGDGPRVDTVPTDALVEHVEGILSDLEATKTKRFSDQSNATLIFRIVAAIAVGVALVVVARLL